MARTKQDPKVQLALDSHRWINTPVVYTKFGSNFTAMQQDIMLLVAGHLQDQIKEFLNEKRYRSDEFPKSIFTQEYLSKGIEPIRIDLSDICTYDSNYERVGEALKAIQELWVKAPSFDPETGLRNGENWYPVFDEVFIPNSTESKVGEQYKYSSKEDDAELKRRRGFIEVHVNAKVAGYVFDMSQGYINHLERIAFFCQSAYTSRIYLMLMKHVSCRNMHPAIPYMEIKDFLGMIERKPKSDEIINMKYEKFSQFRKQVLDVAQRDMDRLAQDNKTEITFEYEPVYKGKSTRGNPMSIRFNIKRTNLGIAHESEMNRRNGSGKVSSYDESQTKMSNDGLPAENNGVKKKLFYYCSPLEDYRIIKELAAGGNEWAQKLLEGKEESYTEEYVKILKGYIEKLNIK